MGTIWYHIAALAMETAWSVAFLNTRVLLDYGLSPLEIYVIRFVIAYVGLLLLTRCRLRWLGWRDELALLACGTCGGTIYFLAENTAVKLTLVSDVAIIVALAPLLTALLSCIVNRDERFTVMMFLGSLVAFAGVSLLTFRDGLRWGDSVLGDLLAFVSAVAWAFYSIVVRRLNKRHSTAMITRKTFFYGIVTAIPFLVAMPWSTPLPTLAKTAVWGNLLFLAIVCSLVVFFIWGVIIKAIGTIRASNYIYLGPFITMIAAAIWFGEPVTLIELAGCALILVGVVIVERKA